MPNSLPTRLENSSLIEVIFELRFLPETPGSGDLLPGMLYGQLAGRYGSGVEQLPLANIPAQIRAQEALRYQPSHRIRGAHGAVTVGERVAAVNTDAYKGWTEFKLEVVALADALATTKLVKRLERCSFRYVNLLSPDLYNGLEDVNVQLKVNDATPTSKGMHLRFELPSDAWDTVVQVIPDASVRTKSAQRSGAVVDIDCIYKGPVQALSSGDRTAVFDEGHQRVKSTFFSLLNSEVIAKMGPEY